ncbi:TPA: hypothetical protein R4S08_004276 [Kluyvera ascorbata]|nr:hypothetical protein [Kluyvera ascorbata]
MNKHNANHVIIIDGHHFKANEDGMWNLTHIWKTLELDRKKAPSEWRTKTAQRLLNCPQKMRVVYPGQFPALIANKQATLKYAAWVSEDFEDMVFAAFESILAMPEVAVIVANKMIDLGYTKEAERLENMNDVQSEALKEFAKVSKRVDGKKPERIFKAVRRGTITKAMGLSQCPISSVWYDRIEDL